MLVALGLRQSRFVNVSSAGRLALYDCDYPTNDRRFIVRGSPDSSRLPGITHYPLSGRAAGYCMCRDLRPCRDDEWSRTPPAGSVGRRPRTERRRGKSQIKQRNKQTKNLLDDMLALI